MQEKNVCILHDEGGADVALKLAETLGAERVAIADDAAEAFASRWDAADAFIFIGALSAAVRSVAPLLGGKAETPALVAVSEDGAVVIPVLPGHMGRASDLARSCADALSSFGAIFAPTAATDRSGLIAPDLWASRRNWRMLLRTLLPSVVRKLVSSRKISVWVDPVLAGSGVSLPLPFGYEATARQQDADLIISPRNAQRLVGAKPQIVPRVVAAEICCGRDASPSDLEKALRKALSSSPGGPFLAEALSGLRTDEAGSGEGGVTELARLYGLPLTVFSGGVPDNGRGDGVTVGLSITDPTKPGGLSVVGAGPGGAVFLTAEAANALSSADAIVVSDLDVDVLPPSLRGGKIIERYGVGEDGARRAMDLARSGYEVALLSFGDPCLFGLAPSALAMAGDLRVNVIPGVSAVQAAAKAIGAPYANGLAMFSLSDRHQPWESALLALEGAALGGVTVALSNPAREGLAERLADVRRIFSDRRLLVVRDAGREGESVREISADALDPDAVDAGTVMFFLSPTARELRIGPDGKKVWLEPPRDVPEQEAGYAG